ncbi:MAG: hypothetical protein AAB513_01625 [Patescibacteria group bacterium]
MSLSDDLLKEFKEEGQNRTPLAKWLVTLLLSLFLLWLVWIVYDRITSKKNSIIGRPLTAEEKKEVLEDLRNNPSPTAISVEKKEEILEQLSKAKKKPPTVSSEEKLKILQGL